MDAPAPLTKMQRIIAARYAPLVLPNAPAYIPIGDGTYEILHNREKKDTHVMNLRGPNYVSEHYHDIPPQIF